LRDARDRVSGCGCAAQLELLAGEELERGSVELLGVFVQRGVGKVLEDDQFGPFDA
jgi:hypothetical protein